MHGKRAARDLRARDPRAELVNLGVGVRDESGKQYWRRAGRPVES